MQLIHELTIDVYSAGVSQQELLHWSIVMVLMLISLSAVGERTAAPRLDNTSNLCDHSSNDRGNVTGCQV